MSRAWFIATITSPVGVTVAVFLLLVQLTVFGVPNPQVTPTNLLDNVLGGLGALVRYARQGQLRRALARSLVLRLHAASRNEGQTFETLSGGQQGRLQILVAGALGREPLAARGAHRQPGRAICRGPRGRLGGVRGTVIAVTHDRWFVRGFDRYLVVDDDGQVYETSEPVWDERRVNRIR